jgi:hypothetical protein
MPAVLAGVLIGLVAIAGITAFLLARRGAEQPQAAPVTPVVSEPAPAPVGSAGAVAGTAGSTLPMADASLPPLNEDFPREAVVALVNGQPFTMGQLESAVRVARSLAGLSGDPVPDYGTQEMRDFQIQMLRRQVDVILMRQGFAAAGLEHPDMPIDGLVSGFLERVGGTQEDLEREMAENGVSRQQLDAWFSDSQDVNLFVQQQLMQGRDPSDPTAREAASRAWLEQQWDAGQIYVNFYDPDAPEWSPPQGVLTPAAATPGAAAP